MAWKLVRAGSRVCSAVSPSHSRSSPHTALPHTRLCVSQGEGEAIQAEAGEGEGCRIGVPPNAPLQRRWQRQHQPPQQPPQHNAVMQVPLHLQPVPRPRSILPLDLPQFGAAQLQTQSLMPEQPAVNQPSLPPHHPPPIHDQSSTDPGAGAGAGPSGGL